MNAPAPSAAAPAPGENPPYQTGIGAPLTTGNWQLKRSGLELNGITTNPIGLIVQGNPTALTGIVTLGPKGFGPIQEEQLQLKGNLNISGVIKTESDVGQPMEFLAKTATGMEWRGAGWISLMGDFSNDASCTGASPRLCQAFSSDLEDYAIFCLGEHGYSAWVRVCRQL